MNKIKFFVIFVFLILGSAKAVHAIEINSQENIEINQAIEENLIAVGKKIKITGHIDGDVFCLAEQSLDISGQVDGDIICLAKTVNISGQINGSVKVAGYNIDISGSISRSLTAIGKELSLNENSIIKKDVVFWTKKMVAKGKIGRDLEGRGLDVFIKGVVGRNINLNIIDQNFNLNIDKESQIGGNLQYLAPHKVAIDTKTVKGKIIYKEQISSTSRKFNFASYGMATTISIFSALVLGLVIISFWRRQTQEITDQMLNQTKLSFGWGLLFVMFLPLLSLFLLFSIIGTSLAIVIVLLWFLVFFVARVFVGILIGRSLLEFLYPSKKDSMIWAMILGIVVLWILFSLPLIGFVFSLLSFVWGAGALALYLRSTIEDNL